MEKPLQIAFKDMESSPFLETIIRERVERLARFHPNIVGCRVVVEVPHRSGKRGKPAIGIAVELEVPGRKIVAREEDDRRETRNDQTAVINRVFDAARRQLECVAELRSHAVKQHVSSGETGVVVQLFPEQDYGFIEVKGSPELHFTRSTVSGGSFDDLAVGTTVMVTRAVTEGPLGPQASSVKLLDGRHSAS